MSFLGGRRRIVWAGVALMLEDGARITVQLDGARQDIQYDFTSRQNYADLAAMERVDPREVEVEIRLAGRGVPWHTWSRGSGHPQEHVEAVEVRAIEEAPVCPCVRPMWGAGSPTTCGRCGLPVRIGTVDPAQLPLELDNG